MSLGAAYKFSHLLTYLLNAPVISVNLRDVFDHSPFFVVIRRRLRYCLVRVVVFLSTSLPNSNVRAYIYLFYFLKNTYVF